MEVQCTGNQLMAPVPESYKKKRVRHEGKEEEEGRGREEEDKKGGQTAEAGQM